MRKEIEHSNYPGSDKDKLYKPTYRHQHHELDACPICAKCQKKEDGVSNNGLQLSCIEFDSDDNQLVTRERLKRATGAGTQEPDIHFGRIASGDLVMKSAHHRDEIAAEEKVSAFEMEGAGMWDNLPTSVIKGVCDYAGSHKNKIWQKICGRYRRAACLKAFLTEWRVINPGHDTERKSRRGSNRWRRLH